MKNIIKTVALLYIKDKRLLLVQAKNKNAFYMPGGKRENDETDHQTLIREVKEELLVDVLPRSIKKYGVFRAQAYGKSAGIDVEITCYLANIKGVPKASAEIDKINFFTYAEYHSMPETAPAVRLIFNDLKIKELIE